MTLEKHEYCPVCDKGLTVLEYEGQYHSDHWNAVGLSPVSTPALIQRVESARGPDRESDLLIWAEFDGRDVREDDNKILAKSRKSPHDECLLGYIDLRNQRNITVARGFVPPIPHYTSSLDAAVSLANRVCPGRLKEIIEAACEAWWSRPNYTADELPRFLVLATLRAVEK